MNQKIKISQLPAKGSNLAAADLLEVAEFTGTGYISKSITGQEIIDAIPVPPSGITIGTTAIASGVVGRVLFQGTGNVVQQSSSLFWDATNNRLGIGTETPSSPLHVIGSATSGFDAIRFKGQYSETGYLATSNGAVYFASGAGVTGSFLELSSAIANLRGGTTAVTFTVGSERMRVNNAGNVLIGTTTDAGFRLDVNGTARFKDTGSAASIIMQYGTGGWITVNNAGGTEAIRLRGGGGASWFNTGQNLLIGTTTDAGFRLDVNGTARATQITATTTGGSFNIGSVNVVDFGDGLRIGYSSTVSKISLFTNSGTQGLQVNNGSVSIGPQLTPNASAILDLTSTTKGFLPPRMTTTQRNAIASPAAGLMVYDTTLNVIMYYNGTMWI